jgi:HK97 family phage prohead protease
MTTPILDVCRTAAFTFARADGEPAGDGLTLEGYAAVFDVPTEINSWEGTFTEQIRRGAFAKTLRERTPVMQFDHGRHPLVGSIPIGTYDELKEDDHGLYVLGRLTDNWLIQPVRDAIAARSITGMSFRFSVVRDEWRDKKGTVLSPVEVDQLLWNPGNRGPLQRTLVEVKMLEAGPVVFAAYPETEVSVRAREIAATVGADGDLRREVIRALAAGQPAPAPTEDEQLRREVARAVLFPHATAAGSRPAPVEARDDEPPAAPPAGHPAPTPDAPPAAGHPSQTEQDRRKQQARRADVTLRGVRRRL